MISLVGMEQTAAEPLNSVLGRKKAFRMVLIFCGLAVVLFCGQAIYYRVQIDERLADARKELPQQPLQANQYFRPVNNYSDWMTLGRVREAQEEFVRDLRDSVIRNFAYAGVPSAQQFQQCQQAVAVINEIRVTMGEEARLSMQLIARAAREGVPKVRDKGTLSSLDSAEALFDYLHTVNAFTPAIMPDYKQWRHEMFDVDPGPLALRDTLEVITGHFNYALQQLDMNSGGNDELAFGPMPANQSDDNLIGAESNLDQALALLATYEQAYPKNIPAQIIQVQASLRYNKGMLKLAHALERGASLPRMGSEFMANRIIRPDTVAIPNSLEMYAVFLNMIDADLWDASVDFAQSETAVSSEQAALVQLLIWHGQNWLHELQRRPVVVNPPADLLARISPARQRQVLQAARPWLITRLQ